MLKCEYFKLQTDVLAEDGRRNMKNLKRSSGYFRRRRFSRRSFRIIAFKLWMLTYFIAGLASVVVRLGPGDWVSRRLIG